MAAANRLRAVEVAKDHTKIARASRAAAIGAVTAATADAVAGARDPPAARAVADMAIVAGIAEPVAGSLDESV